MQSARRILGSLVAIAAVPLAALSVAAFAGALDWRIDLVANARVQLWWASAIALVAALPTRSRVAIGAAGLAVVVNLATIVPLHLPRPADHPTTGDETTLRVATFNLLSTNRDHGSVAAWIRHVDADIVFLHEGTEVWERALVSAGLDGYDIVPGRDGGLDFGTITLVRPGAEVRPLGFRLGDDRAVEVRTPQGVTVLGVHPLAPINQWQATTRDRQLATYGAWAASIPGPRIVAGDFNSTPWTAAFRRLLRAGDLLNSQRGYGTTPTWEVDRWWRIPIDHLVHSNELVVTHREVGPDLGSDHRPLIVDLVVVG